MNTFNLRIVRSRTRRQKTSLRRGAAVVECALTAPLLALAVLGALEVGQYINVAQAVCNASRVGARMASRQDIESATTVESEVKDYLLVNGIPTDQVSVIVEDSSGNTVSGDELADIASGESLTVTVEVEFDVIRRISLLQCLDGASNTSITTMRRE